MKIDELLNNSAMQTGFQQAGRANEEAQVPVVEKR